MKTLTKAVIVIIIIFNIVLIGILGYSVFTLNSLRNDVQENYVTVSEMQQAVDNALEQGTNDGYRMGQSELLYNIRTGIVEEDKSVIATFKELYPEYIVAASGGTYHFVPISDEIEHNQFSNDNVIIHYNAEDPEKVDYIEYAMEGNVISHKGIDVSSHQANIDWKAVAADGVEFVFVRALYRGYGNGKLVEDTTWEANVKGAKAAGIKVGVYAVTQAVNTKEAAEEASELLKLTRNYSFDLPYVLDIERVSSSDCRTNNLSQQERTDIAKTFYDTIAAAGKDVMIYHNTEMGAVLLDIAQLQEYKTWFANYSTQMYWPYTYDIWQYSSTGKVNGIKGNVDLNIWIGDIY